MGINQGIHTAMEDLVEESRGPQHWGLPRQCSWLLLLWNLGRAVIRVFGVSLTRAALAHAAPYSGQGGAV